MKKLLLLLLLLIPLLSIGQWTQIGSNIVGEASNDISGNSVSLSANGTIIAIGSKWNDGGGSNSGSVRMYENISGVWTQIGSDIDGNTSGEAFGGSVSLSDDGTIVAVGAQSNGAGYVRVYENISGVWTQIGVDIVGQNSSDRFGVSLDLSSNGNTIVIGATYNDDSGTEAGQVRVFENISGVWTQIGANLNGEAANDFYGSSVSINSNGSIISIGAINNGGAGGSYTGHVRVFENISGVWTQIGSDIDGEANFDESGNAVSLSCDGSLLAIGASRNDGTASNAGHVRVFENISGVWTQVGIDIDGVAINDRFGFSVSLNCDGSLLVIGAYSNGNAGNDAGQVKVFQNISGVWTQIGSSIDGDANFDWLGYSVGINSDGTIFASGAIHNDDGGVDSGHVKVYDGSTLLSVHENSFGEKFSAYPNPTKGVSKIQLGGNYNAVTVKIFNVLGKQVATHTHNNTNVVELNTQEFTTGIYIVKVQSGAKEATIKLVVK